MLQHRTRAALSHWTLFWILYFYSLNPFSSSFGSYSRGQSVDPCSPAAQWLQSAQSLSSSLICCSCFCFLSLNRPPCIQPHSASLAIKWSGRSRWKLHRLSHSGKCTRQVHRLYCPSICLCIRWSFTHITAPRAQTGGHFRSTFSIFSITGKQFFHNHTTIT